LARAALILGLFLGTSVDDALIALLEEALDTVGNELSALRVRLMISLAVQLQWAPDTERRMRLAREALALARETRDPEALSVVLSRGWALIDGSKPFDVELGALQEEAEAVARATGDPVALAEALHYNAFGAACRGDRTTYEAKLDESVRIFSALRRPLFDWVNGFQTAARAEHHGDLVLAEGLIVEAAELGRRADVPGNDLMVTVGGFLYQIRRAQGRLDEMVDTLADLVESTPALPVLRLVLAGAYVETDRIEEGRPHYMWLAENECANIPPDLEYAVTLCGLARMAYDVRPPVPIVEYIYEHLAPFAGRFNWSGQLLTDPNDLGLAVIDGTLGRNDDADHHFAAAIELCGRAGSRANLARSHFAWARVLADRGDAPAAREHADIAIAMGEELGMDGPFGIVPRGRKLVETLRHI
ncbi:MAG TPA: hypothetical protein VIK54_19475, partial [Acidimicrobiia bacterium]